jgi:hypothetical protein
MNIDPATLEDDLVTGLFRETLREQLLQGFRQIQRGGDRLPTASHYAAQIAEIVSNGVGESLSPDLAFHLYQEILLAVEAARAEVLGEDPQAS